MVEAVDILNVKDRPDIGFTSEAPRSKLSQSQLEQPGRDMQRAMEQWSRAAEEGGAALEKGAVTAAERQAYGDLAKQKVTRDPQGNVQVLSPANSVFWGEAGRRYEDIVRQGTSAQAGLLLNQSMIEAAARNPLDPAKFKTNSDAILDTFQQGPLGQTAAGAEALLHGRQRQIEHLDSITNRAALIEVEDKKKSILDSIEDQKNTMIGLARQNGTDSPEFKSTMDSYVKANQSLTSNPLFKVPQASVDLDIKNTRALMQGEALTEHVDDTYNKKGKAEADAILKKDILENLDLKESDRSRLYAQGKSRLAYLTADQQAGFEADKETLSYLRKGIAEGTIPADGPIVKEARDRFERNHSTQAVSDLDAILQAYPHVKAQQSVPGSPAPSQPAADLISYKNRVAQIENPSGNPNATSSAGATGKYQFMPATWAKFGGGDIHGDQEAAMDRLTAANREALRAGLGREPSGAELYLAHQQGAQGFMHLLAEPSRRAGDIVGDAAIRQNGGNPNAPAREFINMWTAKFNKTPYRPGAPAADGGPSFTAAQIDANPFLLTEWVRAQASDVEDKTAHISAVVAAMRDTVKGGNMPPDESMAMVLQAGERDPGKYGMLAAEAEGIKAAAVSIGGGGGAPMTAPQREAYEQGLTSLVNGQDIYHQKMANTALELMKAQDQFAKDAPLTAYAQRYGLPAPPPIDPEHPETIGASLGARGVLAQHIGALNQSEAPGLLEKGDGQKLAGAFQGQQGAAVLASIASSMRPQDLARLNEEEQFRTNVMEMARSTDPAKLNAANSFLDQQARDNAMEFSAKYGEPGIKLVSEWQNSLAFKNAEDQAKIMQDRAAPGHEAQRKELDKAADTNLAAITPDSVVAKFSSGVTAFGGSTPFGTAAKAPVGLPSQIDAKQALYADYARLYRDAYAETGNAKVADAAATNLLKTKYAVSPSNGNRVMAYAPESYYPPVGGSHDWIREQLDEEVKKTVGSLGPGFGEATAPLQLGPSGRLEVSPEPVLTPAQTVARQVYSAPRSLVSDPKTQEDIANGRPPSYQVVYQGPDGRFNVLTEPDGMTPHRVRFDPTPAQAALGSQMETRKAYPSDWILQMQSPAGMQ